MLRSIRTTCTLALLAFTVSCAGPAAEFAGLPFIEDDYAAALERARTDDLPIFIESWAPW